MMSLDELLAQLQQHGPIGFAIAFLLVAVTAWRKYRTPATPAGPQVEALAPAANSDPVGRTDAQVLAGQAAAVAAKIAKEKRRLQTELATLNGVAGVPDVGES